MGWKGESRRHSLSRKGIKTAGKPNLNTRLQKKFGRPKENIEEIVRGEIQDLISFNGLSAKIIDVKLWGSYLKGKETSESDLDFLLEFEGEEREDDMFNFINNDENRIYLEGVPVDVNPIKAEKSGTIKEFLARGETIEFDRDKRIPQLYSAREWDKQTLRKEGFSEESAGFGESATVLFVDGNPVLAFSELDGAIDGFSIQKNYRNKGMATQVIKAWLQDEGQLEFLDVNQKMLQVLKRSGKIIKEDNGNVIVQKGDM